MHNKCLTLLIAITCFNASYGMNNDEQLQQKQLYLLEKDNDQTLNIVKTLSTGYSNSKLCFCTALAGLTCGVIACLADKNIAFRAAGMGATLFGGSAVLGVASMHNEQEKIKICNVDLYKINESILQIPNNKYDILSDVGIQSRTYAISETNNQINIKQSSPQVSIATIDAYSRTYATLLGIIEKLTTGFSNSKICFYTTLTGLGLCSLAWLNDDNNTFPMARIGSILFLGAGAIGMVSTYSDQQKLIENMNAKANLRTTIMKIKNL